MDFLQMMVAGLAGSPSMIHCTVLAITRIVFEYRKVNSYPMSGQFSLVEIKYWHKAYMYQSIYLYTLIYIIAPLLAQGDCICFT